MQSYARLLIVLALLAISSAQASAQKEPAADDLAEQLKPLFDSLGKMSKAEIGKHFDVDRMLDLVLANDRISDQLRREPEFRKRALAGLAHGLAKKSASLRWDNSTIKNVKKLAPDNLVVTVRHAGAPGETLNIRWWVTKKEGAWKIYDLEERDVGLRLSDALVGVVGEIIVDGKDTIRELTLAGGVVRDLGMGRDLAVIERKLRHIENARLPKNFDALRQLANAMVKIERQQWDDALQTLDKAHALNSDVPRVILLKAVVFSKVGNADKAVKHLQEYENLFGDDPVTFRLHGELLQNLGRLPEAAVSYRKALDHNPKDGDAFLGLVRSLEPGETRDDLGVRFGKLGDSGLYFDKVANHCLAVQDGESLREVAGAMKRIDPKYVPADLALAIGRIMTRQVDQALPLFKQALGQIDADQRQRWITEFMRGMVMANRSVDAYATLPDAKESFRFLANELRNTGRSDDLGQLVKAHARKNADDPLLPFYQGHLHVMDGRFALADKEFTKGMAKPPEPEVLEQFRFSRIQASYHSGQMMRAYAEIEPRRQTYQHLANLCLSDRKYDELQKLLDEHAKKEPDDLSVHEFRYRVKIKQGKVTEGIALFKVALAKQEQDFQRQQVLSNFLMEMADAGKAMDAYLAAPDALKAFQILGPNLAMNRPKELDALAEAHRKRHPNDPWLSVVAAEKLMREKSWDKAARVYEGIWKTAPVEFQNRFRYSYVNALGKAGRALQAYKQIEPRDETFQELVDVLWNDKKGKELEALVAAHRANVGDKAELNFQQARAKILLKEPEEAIRLYQKAVQNQTDKYMVQSFTSMFVHAMNNAGQGLAAYGAAADKGEAFRILANSYLQKKQEKALEALLTEHGLKHSQDLWFLYYRGELHLLRGELDQADRDFRAALAKAKPRDDPWLMRNGLARAKIKAGKLVELYREMGPRWETFQELCYVCVNAKNVEQLDALVAARRMEDADDLNLPAWDLEVLWLKKDYQGAVKLIEQHRGDVFDLQRHRSKSDAYLVRSLVKLGRSVDAIKEAESLFKNRRGSPALLVLAHASAGDAKQAIAVVDRFPNDRYLVENCYRDADLGPILRDEAFQAFRTRFPEPKASPPTDIPND